MVLNDLPNLEDIYTSLCSSTVEDSEMDFDSGLEDDDSKSDSILEDSTIFVAFKGNIDDKDFKWKLDTILENVPNLLHMGNLLNYFSVCYCFLIALLWLSWVLQSTAVLYFAVGWKADFNCKVGILGFFFIEMLLYFFKYMEWLNIKHCLAL